jgi:hypothetical protein
MEISGVGISSSLPQFLVMQYGVTQRETFEGLPVFADSSSVHVGGFRGFYSALPTLTEPEAKDLVVRARKQFPHANIDVSVPHAALGGGRVNFFVELDGPLSQDARLQRYDKKTRNQVRQARSQSLTVSVEVGSLPKDFVSLHRASAERLGSAPKDPAWIERLQDAFAANLVCVSAFADGTLIGVNCGIRNGDYFLLVFNHSLEAYWPQRINHLLYDGLIAWAASAGIRLLDFGPGMERDESHNRFKEGFGATRAYLVDDVGLWTKQQFKRKLRAMIRL